MLPILPGFVAVLRSTDLIALVVHDKDHADRCQRWRNNEDQNPTAQRLNHSLPSGCGLRVAQRTLLGKGWRRRQYEHQAQESEAQSPGCSPFHSMILNS